jgi:alkaline phosphatase
MSIRVAPRLYLTAILASSILCAQPHASNVILFVGDGAGLSSLNAASIYGYREPQALFVQRMPHLAMAETATADEWVTDASAAATAMATGRKTVNGVVSQSAQARKGKRDGETLKTILEFAEENGLATGIVSNAGLASGVVAPFFAHGNDRARDIALFVQILDPRFGDGLDVAIGSRRSKMIEGAQALGIDMPAEFRKRQYVWTESLNALEQAGSSTRKAIVALDDDDFDLGLAVAGAIRVLSRNPKGFFLVVHSDCHLKDTKTDLERIIQLDRLIEKTVQQHGRDSLVIFTADHSFDLRIPKVADKSGDIIPAIALVETHTAEEVPVAASGPGSERVEGFVSNTKVFDWMMEAFGWRK